MMEIIKQNAVCYTPNETYLKTFEAIRQESGEKVDPYLSRLKSAAIKVFIKKNAEKGAMYICDDTDGEIKGTGGAVLRGQCPPCCKEVDDLERRDWMLKKQFLANMLNARN